MTEPRKLPTPEEWKQIENWLSGPYRDVEMLIDGYKVLFRVGRLGALRYGITFFVNGVFRGAWLIEDCEERRRFFNSTLRPVYPRKFYKGLSAKTRKTMGINFDKKFPAYSVVWTSFKRLKSHLLKNNHDIEWVNKPVIPAEAGIQEKGD